MIGIIVVIGFLALGVVCPELTIALLFLTAVVLLVILVMRIARSTHGDKEDTPPPKPKEKNQQYMTQEDFMASVDMYANWDYGDD